MAMARYRPDVSPSCRSWQEIALMRSRRGFGREKHQFVAIYRRHVFRLSLFWQDMRGMYPKSPAKRRWGMHRASILPPKGLFAVRSSQIMHGVRILPPFDESGPCAGMTSHTGRGSRTLLNAWPLRGDAHPSVPPIPATCRTPHKRNEDANSQERFWQQAIDSSRKSRMEAVKNRMRESRVEPCRREQRRAQQHSTGCNAAIPAHMPLRQHRSRDHHHGRVPFL